MRTYVLGYARIYLTVYPYGQVDCSVLYSIETYRNEIVKVNKQLHPITIEWNDVNFQCKLNQTYSTIE